MAKRDGSDPVEVITDIDEDGQSTTIWPMNKSPLDALIRGDLVLYDGKEYVVQDVGLA